MTESLKSDSIFSASAHSFEAIQSAPFMGAFDSPMLIKLASGITVASLHLSTPQPNRQFPGLRYDACFPCETHTVAPRVSAPRSAARAPLLASHTVFSCAAAYQ